ncbi:MAG TPA: carboxypeptidase-like regulatory domain-containing protein, partial [Steroidobacteraceae bacterium]|nr:carboxypeptidase-like regulatory domain-containing protein [Steroidobacteraceae bacterium]
SMADYGENPVATSEMMRWIRILVAATGVCGSTFAADTPPPAGMAGQAAPAVAVDGRVLDADGQPVASAGVAIMGWRRPGNAPGCPQNMDADEYFGCLLATGAVRAWAVAGADGRFTLQVPGGLVNSDEILAVGKDASGGTIRTSWPIGPNRSLPATTLGDIRLNRRYDFTVQVQSNGRPVAGALVDFGNTFRQYTDATGSTSRHLDFTAGRDELLAMPFTVHAAGFATDEWGGGIAAGTTRHVIDLVPEALQTGRITDGDGRAPAQAVVTAAPVVDPMGIGIVACTAGCSLPPDRTAGTARTDATGAFTLHGLRAGRRYRLSVTSSASSVADSERVITAGNGPVDVVMHAMVPLKLIVSGAPLPAEALAAGIQSKPERAMRLPLIVLEELDSDTGEWRPVYSPFHVEVVGTHNEVLFDRVPVGMVRFRVTNTATGIAADISDPVTVESGKSNIVPLQLMPSRPLRLRIIDEDGNPVAGARVEAQSIAAQSSSYATTEADGSVSLPVHPARDVKITVTLSGRWAGGVTLYGGATHPDPIVVSIPQ